LKLKGNDDLITIILLNILLIILILCVDVDILKIIVGLPFALFFPGYVFIAALYPTKKALSSVERLTLSIGMSLAVVPLIGLVLNFLPYGIKLYPILISLTVFILITAIIAVVRRQCHLPEDRYTASFNSDFLRRGKKGKPAAEKKSESIEDSRFIKPSSMVLTVILLLTICACIASIIYVAISPKAHEKYTEFYILGTSDKAANYPKEIKLGETALIMLCVINHEQQDTTYEIDIMVEGDKADSEGPIILRMNEKWEKEVIIKPINNGANQKVELLLYKNRQPEYSLRLHLWINVN